MTKTVAEDLTLVHKCVDGDENSAETLVRKYSNLIFHTVQYTLYRYHVNFHREDVEDLYHTVFLHLFDNKCSRLRQYKGKNGCSLATWLRVVSLRVVLNELRKKAVLALSSGAKTVSLELFEGIEDPDSRVDGQVENAKRIQMVEAAVQQLSARYRLFYRLYYDQGLTLQETAQAMDTSLENIYTLKSRTIHQLKKNIAAS